MSENDEDRMRWEATAGGRFKLRHLHLMAEIGASGSLGVAARALRITQPAASRLLAEIEAIVGAPVFDRLPRGLRPNACGEVLIRRAQGALAELGAAAQELDALRAGSGGCVALGTVTAPAVDVVARVLTDMQATDPGLQIGVEVATSPVLVRMLLDGKLDFVLARIPAEVDAGALDYCEVEDEELTFLAREDHPLAAREDLCLADLVAPPWVMQPPGTLLRRRVEQVFRSAGLAPPTQVLNTPSALLTVAVLARGGVVGALTASVADLFAGHRGLRRLTPIAGIGRIAVEPLGLIRLRDRAMSPAVARVYTAIRTRYALRESDAQTIVAPELADDRAVIELAVSALDQVRE